MIASKRQSIFVGMGEPTSSPVDSRKKSLVWNDGLSEYKTDSLLGRARQGNVKAMESVAHKYFHGTGGFKRDPKMAYNWYGKANQAGSVIANAFLGYMLATGVGVELNEKEGTKYLRGAAERGSDWAAYMLGIALADGKCGLSVNVADAAYWLEISLSGQCEHRHMSEDCTRDALDRLDKIFIPRLLARVEESTRSASNIPSRTR